MKTIPNPNAIIAENLFILLKKEFPDYINYKLDSNLSIEMAHVYDVINISFPEVVEGTAFTIVVTSDELNVSDNTTGSTYNTKLLEDKLMDFLSEKAG